MWSASFPFAPASFPLKQKILGNTRFPRIHHGGDKRDRTADLLNAIQALSQLSYTPIFSSLFSQLLHYSKVRMFCQGVFSFFFFPVLLHESANLHPRIKRRVTVIHEGRICKRVCGKATGICEPFGQTINNRPWRRAGIAYCPALWLFLRLLILGGFQGKILYKAHGYTDLETIFNGRPVLPYATTWNESRIPNESKIQTLHCVGH